MTDLTGDVWSRTTVPRRERVEPPPAPHLPVFIHDCVIPCQGTTLLAVLLKRDLERLDQD
ncbi:MAG: hypothetical protein ACU0DW_07095 [Shimia sp.]